MRYNLDFVRKRFCETKGNNPKAVLLLRIGSLYHALYEDAFLVARLTGYPVQRLYGYSRLLHCGFPHEQLSETVGRLRSAGYRARVRT